MKEGNNPELIFINKLRETFSNQFGEEFSNNKLSGFFGSSALFNETLRKKRNFSERILFRIKKSIEEKLTLENREYALNALFEYMGDQNKKQTNQPEIDLIESLRDIISIHKGIPIDYTNLGRFFENQALFYNTIKRQTSFKEYIINKIEWIIKHNLDEKLKILALKILKKYRISKNYKIEPSTPVEELISVLQECFSNQNNKFFTISEMSNLIGGKSLLSFSARNNSKLYQLTLIIIEQIIEENLTNLNKKKALVALKSYKSKIGYSVDSTEIDFIKELLEAFSKGLQKKLYLTELSEIFASKSILNESLRKKTKFTKLTLEKIEKTIIGNLKDENLNKALKALLNYKSMHGYVDESEAEKSIEKKLAESIRRTFNSHYNEVLSYNKIGELLGDRQLFSRIFYEKKVLKKDTINRLIENVKKVLDGQSLNEVISTLKKYLQLRRYEKKIEIFNADSKLNEEICRCIFEELFHPYKFPTVSIFTFNWLIGPKGGSMHIDGYSIELNLGFEFNGIQHYEIDGYLNKTKRDLERTQKSDFHKEELVNNYGKRVIVIPYTVKKKYRVNFIIEECRKLGINISKSNTNIDIKQIEVKARNQIKNRKKEKNNLKKANICNSTQMPSHPSVPYPNSNPHRKILDEDFSDPYLWFSPQVREAIRSKAESLIDQVHEGVSAPENFSDPWDKVSNYDSSEAESISAEDLMNDPEEDIIPDQDIEAQEGENAHGTEITGSDEEIEDLISEQEELTEDQISDLEQINDSDDREGDIKPDDFDPIIPPDYDPLPQPITELIPPPEPSTNPEDISTPGQEKGTETPNSPSTQQEQKESSQIPEKTQDELETEQNIEEILNESNVQDIDTAINDDIEQIQNPDLGDSSQEDLPNDQDINPEDADNINQDEGADSIEEEKEEIEDKEEQAQDEKNEEDNKDESEDEMDREKDDDIEELPEEIGDESQEGEQESDSDSQEGNPDDMDDFEDDSEIQLTPEQIINIMIGLAGQQVYPENHNMQSSNLDPSRGDIIIIDGRDDLKEKETTGVPSFDDDGDSNDFKEKETTEVPSFDDDGAPDDLSDDEIKDGNLDNDLGDFL